MTAPERKDATALVDEWLLEPENYGLRIERLAESFPSNMGELTPWLVAACDCGLSQHQAALDRIAELEESLAVMASDNPCTCKEGYRGRGLRDPDCQAYMFGDDAREALGLPLACQAVLAKGDG